MRSAILLLALAAGANAHICLLDPPQRGGPNITGPGNMACFQPDAPCGKMAASAPVLSFVAGQTATIKLQQNLNHYNVGNPGYIDVAWAPYPEPSSDDDFNVLRTLPDYWSHLQASQTNFTINVLMPNISSSHAVLRVRYHPNKPTEPIFHQCADIAITEATSSEVSLGTVLSIVGGPLKTSKLYADTPLEFSLDGQVAGTGSIKLDTGMYLSDGLAAYPGTPDAAFYIGGASTGADIPMELVSYGRVNGRTPIVDTAGKALEGQVDAIVATNGASDAPLLMIGRVGNASNFFFYQARYLYSNGTAGDVIAQSEGQQTFVNFMWAANVDSANGKAYFLAGDENSLYKLNLALFTVDLTAKTVSRVLVDNTAFTLSSLHFDPATTTLYGVSPGLYFSDHSYSLVKVDPTTGMVAAIGTVAPAGKFEFTYQGGLYGSSIVDGQLMYMFTDAKSGGKQVASIDLTTGSISQLMSLDDGVNHVFGMTSPMFLPKASVLA